MVLDELLTPSEFKLVMDDIKNFPTNFVENGVQLFDDHADICGPSQSHENDNSEYNVRRKKQKKLCDSTYENLPAGGLEILPCLESYPGQFDFQLHLPADSTAHRWTYSKILKKVFIDIDKVLALQFKWNFRDLKPDLEFYIRAMPVFTSHDSLKIPVIRCPIHLMMDNPLNANFRFTEHVMRCEHSSTNYVKDERTNRFSCITPLSRPQPGSETTTLTYKFVCKTSCLGGMNRKPISVIFTLEDASGTEYGRQLLAVKICSCPKRDKLKEEKNDEEKTQSSSSGLRSFVTVPSLTCVRNVEAGANSQGEVLRDIKTSYPEVATNSLHVEEHHKSKTSLSGKPSGKMKREREEDCSMRDIRDLLIKSQQELKKANESLSSVLRRHENEENSSFWRFARYMEAELNELPVEVALQLQNDWMKQVTEKRLQLLRQNLSNNILVPETSITSPGFDVTEN